MVEIDRKELSSPGYTICLELDAHHVNATPSPSENQKVRKAQTETQSTVTTAYYQPSYGRNRPERIIPPPVYTGTAGPTPTRQLQKPNLLYQMLQTPSLLAQIWDHKLEMHIISPHTAAIGQREL